MGRELADKFVGMYVNHWTLDYGADRGGNPSAAFWVRPLSGDSFRADRSWSLWIEPGSSLPALPGHEVKHIPLRAKGHVRAQFWNGKEMSSVIGAAHVVRGVGPACRISPPGDGGGNQSANPAGLCSISTRHKAPAARTSSKPASLPVPAQTSRIFAAWAAGG